MSDIYTTAPVPTIGESYEIGRAHGVRAEQQRIIRLIEPFTVCDDDCDHYGCTTFVAEQVIALIKGEK